MFDLTKWYADAVSAEGDLLVGYSARLQVGRFSASYSSLLDSEGQRQSLKPTEITAGKEEIHWIAPALGLDARWKRNTSSVSETIYRDEHGAVEWHCLVPGGTVSGTPMGNALGYVERLRLTIAPWRLPLRELRWGRYLSARHSLIWIDWEGAFRGRWVFLDGRRTSAGEAGDRGLALSEGTRLSLDCGLVIRSGVLASTVFQFVPGLDRIAPARMFQVYECKWRSRGVLQQPGAPDDEGWSIHEVVRWP